jgi:hypothetical protein
VTATYLEVMENKSISRDENVYTLWSVKDISLFAK